MKKSISCFVLLLFLASLAPVKCSAFVYLPDTTIKPSVLYLSFDDGPYPISYRIDSIARADSVPITVFLVGRAALRNRTNRTLLRNYRNNPFIGIANHSYSHAGNKYKNFYKRPMKVMKDLLLNEDTLALNGRLARLPGRNTWRCLSKKRTDLLDANAAADSLQARGFSLLGWDAEWLRDSVHHSFFSAQTMIGIVSTQLKTGKTFQSGKLIILCHDPMLNDGYFLQQLLLFIGLSRKEGFSFGLLKDYCN